MNSSSSLKFDSTVLLLGVVTRIKTIQRASGVRDDETIEHYDANISSPDLVLTDPLRVCAHRTDICVGSVCTLRGGAVRSWNEHEDVHVIL